MGRCCRIPSRVMLLAARLDKLAPGSCLSAPAQVPGGARGRATVAGELKPVSPKAASLQPACSTRAIQAHPQLSGGLSVAKQSRSCRHTRKLDDGCLRVTPLAAQSSTCSEVSRLPPSLMEGRDSPAAAGSPPWRLGDRPVAFNTTHQRHWQQGRLTSDAAPPCRGWSSWPRCQHRRRGCRRISPLAVLPHRLLAPQDHLFGRSVSCRIWH